MNETPIGFNPKLYFADVFDVEEAVLEKYGAFNITLVNDLPLFVDPFLLFDSKDKKFQALHDDVVKYLCFLRDRAVADELTPAGIKHWLYFKEIKQNWLGFSKTGNSGTGLGGDFANSLARNLSTVFKTFGTETLTSSSHMEKLGLLSGGVGRDHLSDFTTNLINGFLLDYTQAFALKHLDASQRKRFHIDRVTFNYEAQRWNSCHFELPYFNGDYVLLTPKEILTRDEAWINQSDMLDRFTEIRNSLDDDSLRAQVNEHFLKQITKKSSEKELKGAALNTIEKFHELLDYYIRWKEEHADEAHLTSGKKVRETEVQFVENIRALVTDYLAGTSFYDPGSSYQESLARVKYLKAVIEDKGGHRLFYVNGKPVQRETDLHVMYRLTWYGTDFDVNAEVNNGRGPVDFKVSKGKKNANLIEFKLAKNTGLEMNLQHQVRIYDKSSDTDSGKSIKAIMFFSLDEKKRVVKILQKLKMDAHENIVLIDAGLSTKASASKANES
jgi:hypothetical protein